MLAAMPGRDAMGVWVGGGGGLWLDLIRLFYTPKKASEFRVDVCCRVDVRDLTDARSVCSGRVGWNGWNGTEGYGKRWMTVECVWRNGC